MHTRDMTRRRALILSREVRKALDMTGTLEWKLVLILCSINVFLNQKMPESDFTLILLLASSL